MAKIKLILLSIFLSFTLAVCSSNSPKPELEPNKRGSSGNKPELTDTNSKQAEEIQPVEEVKKVDEAKKNNKNSDKKKIEEQRKEDNPGDSQEKPIKIEEDENIIINLEDVSTVEFAEVVFSELLKKNYVIPAALKKSPTRITVRMSKSVPKNKVIYLVSKILREHNIVIQEKEDTYYLFPQSQVKSLEPKFRYGKTPPREELGIIFQIIPLDHIATSQLDFIIRRFLSKSGTYLPEGHTNSLIIIDYPERIANILGILEILDKDFFENILLKIAQPTYWEPSDLTKQIYKLLDVESIPTLRPRTTSIGVLLLPIDRSREIYIFSSNEKWLDRVFFFIDKLDNPKALGGEKRTFIYFPVNTSAQDLGAIVAKALGRAETPEKTAPQEELSEKIIIDESRNALIFITSPSNWETIKDLLEKIDIPAKQVLIECIIGELTLDEQFQLGLEWFIKNSGIKIHKKTYTSELGTEGGLGLGGLGFLYTFVADDDAFRAAINAFISQDRIEIISAPRIIATDNKEAVIQVGTDVPIITSEAVTGQIQQQGSTGLLRSVQYRATGVILTVKPTIHSSGVVSLDIRQELSEAQTNQISPGISSPLVLKRSINTSLVAKNGQTIFIGGLISKNVSITKKGVPILSKIPLIGSLFRSTSESVRKTELIILLTPHILSDSTELEYITDEFQKRIMPDIVKFSLKEKGDKKKKNENK